MPCLAGRPLPGANSGQSPLHPVWPFTDAVPKLLCNPFGPRPSFHPVPRGQSSGVLRSAIPDRWIARVRVTTPDQAVRRMASFYFLFYAGGGMYFPYLTLYLESHHVSPGTVGLLTALGPAVGLVSQPLWGRLADRRERPLWVLRRLALASAVLIAIVPLLPVPLGTGAGLLAYAALASPLVALADTSTLRLLSQGTGQLGSAAYPRIRAWGSLSFAITAVISSLIFADHGLWRAFVFMGIALLLSAALLPGLEPARGDVRLGASDSRAGGLRSPVLLPGAGAGTDPGSVITRLWRAPGFAIVVGSAFLLQVANSAHSTFFPLYLLKVHMPAQVIGAPWAAAALVEVPMFMVMPVLERRVGVRRLVTASLLLYAVRFFLFSLIRVAWPVMLIQLMQGVTFTFFTAGMVMLAGRLAPTGLKAQGQTAFMAVSFSLSAILGNVVGGVVVGNLGVFGMYRLAAAISLVAAALFGLGLRPWQKRDGLWASVPAPEVLSS